jgi:hypothetical protein
VFDIVFANLDRTAAKNAWREQLTKPADDHHRDKKRDDDEE